MLWTSLEDQDREKNRCFGLAWKTGTGGNIGLEDWDRGKYRCFGLAWKTGTERKTGALD